jgi:3-hydroxyisobutyrate dehydrogenase-like beta-hydroxyacid dehydrogenase
MSFASGSGNSPHDRSSHATKDYHPVGARPSLIRKDYGLILEAAAEGLVPMPLAGLIHERLTVAKGREVSESAGL